MTAEGGYWQQQLTRRRVVRGIASGSAGVAAAGLLGCRERDEPPTVPAASQPKQGGILTRQSSWELRGLPLDPHVNSALAGTFFGFFYQGLIGYDYPAFDVLKPELARGWEQVSETEYLFTLQPGVKWHEKPPANGRPLTVDDVVFSLERIRTREPRFVNRSALETVDKVEAVDHARVRITTIEPDAGLLIKLSGEPMKILARDVVEKANRFATVDEAVGTGPFIITERVDEVRVRYVRNPAYWKPGLPYLDEVRGPWFADDETQWAAFLAGKVDVATVPRHEIEKYIRAQGPTYQPDFWSTFGMFAFQANVTVSPTNDPRVYKALRLLIDHEALLTAINLGWGRYGSILPSSLAAWDLTHEEYKTYLPWKSPKDEAVRVALDLLRAAGFDRTTPLRFKLTGAYTRPADDTAQQSVLVQARWRELSQGVVDASLEQVDNVVGADIRTKRQFIVYWGGNAGAANEPDVWLTQLYKTGGSRNYAGWSDPVLDAMADRQRRLFDREQRKAALREIIIYCIDNCPVVKGIESGGLGTARPYVRNWRADQFPMGRQYENVWLDM